MPKRATNAMPDDVRRAIVGSGLMDEYEARPHYQRNDYLGWISRAQRRDTRQRRIEQMLDELARGGVYMKMDHPPSRRV